MKISKWGTITRDDNNAFVISNFEFDGEGKKYEDNQHIGRAALIAITVALLGAIESIDFIDCDVRAPAD